MNINDPAGQMLAQATGPALDLRWQVGGARKSLTVSRLSPEDGEKIAAFITETLRESDSASRKAETAMLRHDPLHAWRA